MKGKNTLKLSPVALRQIVEHALNSEVFQPGEAVTVEAIRVTGEPDPTMFEIDFVERGVPDESSPESSTAAQEVEKS